MKNLYMKVCTLLAATLALASCGDFLEETSQDEFKPETTEDYQEILNGSGYCLFTYIDQITTVLSDDADGADLSTYDYSSYYYTEDNLTFKDLLTWQPNVCQLLEDKDKDSYYDNYQKLYSLIMVCNTVIDGIEGSTGTATEYAQTRGEALALRAFYYWYLVNLYGLPYNMQGTTPDQLAGVPLVLTSEIKDEGPSRNTVAEVYKQITTDIEEACTLLETSKNTKISHYRINWVAAHLFASRVYLYMEEWDKVIAHADKALEGAPALVDLNNYTLTNYYGYATNSVISDSFTENIFINGSRPTDLMAATLIRVSDDIYNLFPATDKRKTMYLATTTMYDKYRNAKQGNTRYGSFVWRTAELYLNRAEAYAQKYAAGDNTAGAKAVNDINTLRQARIATGSYEPYTLSSSAELTQFIRDERRRELCFENPHRWFDLRRYGMPELKHAWYDLQGNKTTYTLEKNDVGYALPIPNEALEANNNLTQNELHAVREGI